MKYYLAVLFGALFCFGAFIPATAEARGDRDYYDSPYYARRDREDRRHKWKKRHKHARKVWRRAHFEWRYGRRVWVPGRYVTVYVYRY